MKRDIIDFLSKPRWTKMHQNQNVLELFWSLYSEHVLFLTLNTSTLCKNTSKEVTTVFVVHNFYGVNLKLVSSSFPPLKVLEQYLNYEKCKFDAFTIQCIFNLVQSTQSNRFVLIKYFRKLYKVHWCNDVSLRHNFTFFY